MAVPSGRCAARKSRAKQDGKVGPPSPKLQCLARKMDLARLNLIASAVDFVSEAVVIIVWTAMLLLQMARDKCLTPTSVVTKSRAHSSTPCRR
eukprot:2595403-Prymnesium_polylepis.1